MLAIAGGTVFGTSGGSLFALDIWSGDLPSVSFSA